jgi:hypothetical protein
MKSIERQIQKDIIQDFFLGKIIVILGARQVGKSTLMQAITKELNQKMLWLDGENSDVHALFEQPDSQRLRDLVKDNKILVIDEAQKIDKIGSILKLYADYHKDIQVIASGSSAFELKDKLNEPLTGRKFEYHLYPLSFSEMAEHHGMLTETRLLTKRMVYGYYPEIVTMPDNEERILRFLSDSYLYKDIFLYKGLKRPEKILDLLRLLAWQIGSEVSYNELSNTLGIDNQTVETYIQFLEQTFIVYKLNAYNRNQRNELKKTKKIYFNDLGIRNALINDFRDVQIRSDIGSLFENYVINEMRKQNDYLRKHAHLYFWRSADQREVDLILDKNGVLNAFEIKWSDTKKIRLTKSFTNLYPNHTFTPIHKGNYMDVLKLEMIS